MLPVTTQTDGIASHAPSFRDDEARWEAVRQRDCTADGAFLYSVQTTGVYCRALLRGAASASRKRGLPGNTRRRLARRIFGHANSVGRMMPRVPPSKPYPAAA
jgi:hypothetical protein